MSEELKPCPFCGSKRIAPEIFNDDDDVTVEYAISCLNCKAQSSYFTSFEDAINAWNTRAKENA